MKVKKAGFDHSNPVRFTQGRWIRDNKVSKAYLVFKWFIALFLFSNQILSFWYNFDKHLNPDFGEKYMIYATHWGFILITLSTILDAILVLVRYSIERSQVYMKKRQPFYENSHFLLKTSIGLTATAYPTALFVTLVFWSFLFNYNETFHFNLGSWINLTVHLFQTLIALIDTFVSSRPWRLWHIWCPMVFGLVYGIFNIIYIVAFDGTDPFGHDYVYDILDWNNNPGMSAAFVCGTVVLFPILVSVFYFLAKFRDFLWSKYYAGGGVEAEQDSIPTSIGTSTQQRNGIYTVSIKLQDQ